MTPMIVLLSALRCCSKMVPPAGAGDLWLWCCRYPCLYASGHSGISKSHDAGAGYLYRRQIILSNTYHLMLRPGPERVERLGGVRKLMGWDGPLLTDQAVFRSCLWGRCAI